MQGSAQLEFWNGNIAEILVYNSSLSQANFNSDVSYLTSKWLTSAQGVPEPASLVLLFLGLAAMVALKRNYARG